MSDFSTAIRPSMERLGLEDQPIRLRHSTCQGMQDTFLRFRAKTYSARTLQRQQLRPSTETMRRELSQALSNNSKQKPKQNSQNQTSGLSERRSIRQSAKMSLMLSTSTTLSSRESRSLRKRPTWTCPRLDIRVSRACIACPQRRFTTARTRTLTSTH